VQARLAHDIPQDGGAAQPAQARLGKGHGTMVRRLSPLLAGVSRKVT
jgi:hypothetical protein